VRQNWRDSRGVDGGEPGVDSRDEGKHTGRNDLLFVKKMMWMDEEKTGVKLHKKEKFYHLIKRKIDIIRCV